LVEEERAVLKRRVCVALLGIPTALLLLALCTALAAPSVVVEAQGGPQATLVIGTTDEVASLDPADRADISSWEILYNVASGLLSFVPGTSELAPGLATSMPEVSPDGLVYTFHLRSGLHFPDGTAFDAYDVRDSIDRVMADGGDAKSLVTDYVTKVEVVNSTTVRFTLKEPTAFFPALVAMAPYYPVSIGGQCFDPYELEPSCTCGGIGPYTIVNWDQGVSLELEANPDYYGPPPETYHITVRYYSTPEDLRQALEDGDVDVAWRALTTQDYQDFELQPDFQVVANDSGLVRYLAFNTITDTPPFDNPNIRTAIAEAVDREAIAHEVFTDSMTSLYSMVPQGMWSHDDSFFDLYGQRNLTEAITLLRDEGYGDTDELTIGTTDDVSSLDPAEAYGTGSWEVLYNVASGLLSYVPGTTEITPGLATALPEVSPDGLVYTFTLKSGLQFPDGTDFDAYAVAESINRVMEHGGEAKSLVTDYVSAVEAVNSTTVRFTLEEPTAFFPALVAMAPYYPVSIGGECFDPDDLDPGCTCGGIGPYTIVNWDQGVSLELEANPDYYGPAPETSHVFVRYYTTTEDLRQALEEHDVDVAWRGLTPQDYEELKLEPDFDVLEGDGGLIRYLAFNTITDTPPFSTTNVRRAIAAAIDRDSIAQDVFTGTMASLYSMVPQGMWSHKDSFSDLYGERNLAEAVSLLATEGYTEDNKLEFELWYPLDHYGSTEPDLAAALEQDLEESGVISVTIRGEEWSAYRDLYTSGELPAFLLGWWPDYMDPDNCTWPFAHSGDSDDFGIFYSNPEMDSLLEGGRENTPVHGVGRQGIYEDIQDLWAAEAPTIPLLQGLDRAAVWDGVQGVMFSPSGLLPYFTMSQHRVLEFQLWYGLDHYGPTEPGFAAALKEDLEETGAISVTVRGEDWGTFVGHFTSGQLGAFLLAWRPDYMDPDNYLWPFGHSSASGDMGVSYANPAMDELLENGRDTIPVHGAERETIYKDIQDLWAEEVPTIPLLQGLNFAVVEKGVHGVKPAYFELLPYFTLRELGGYVPLVMRNY
jgi:peptide/nickel transport system substrate-binding protein